MPLSVFYDGEEFLGRQGFSLFCICGIPFKVSRTSGIALSFFVSVFLGLVL